MLFDRICRDNGIIHRLTQPRHPTTTGKIERFHGCLRRELLDDAVPFADLAAAQAAVDAWVSEYNTTRPHQAIGMAVPAERFSTAAAPGRAGAAAAAAARGPRPGPGPAAPPARSQPRQDRRLQAPPARAGPMTAARWSSSGSVPASGNMQVAGRQFWLGPAPGRADRHVLGRHRRHPPDHRRGPGQVGPLPPVRLRPGRARRRRRPPCRAAAAAARRARRRDGGRPDRQQGRRLSTWAAATSGRGDPRRPAAVGSASRRHTLMFFDPETRELLRTRPSPLTWDQARRLRGARPAGPPPRPRPSRSPPSGGPATPASSWSPGRRSP